MDVREFVATHAAEFSQAPREWLAIPSVSGDPACHGDVRRPAEWLATPLVFVAVGLDADRIHAPNEYVDLPRLLLGAQTTACLWDELAATGAGSR